jgi:hypothetical protein
MGVFSFVKAGKKIFGKPKSTGSAIKSVKLNVPSTRLEKASRDLKIAKQKTKGAGAKLKQTTFEIKQGEYGKLTFDPMKKDVTKKSKLREKKMGGGMMGRRFGMDKGGKVPTTPKEKSLAKLAPPKDKITFGDVIAGRTKKAGGGPAMSKLPAKEERKQKAQKRMTAANKFVKNRKRSFGSIMREKHMR